MTGSIFTAVLNNIQKYFEDRTPITMYIPVAAFLGACFLVFIVVFGVEAPLAFWNQLSADLRIILITALVFFLLFLTFLASELRILLTQAYQGLWPQIIHLPGVATLTYLRRMTHVRKWQTLHDQHKHLRVLEDECRRFEEDHVEPEPKLEIWVPNYGLPRGHLICDQDLGKTEKSEQEIGTHGWLKSTDVVKRRYTLEPLPKGQGITRNQICRGAGSEDDGKRVIVFVPLSPHAAPAAKADVQPGEHVDIFLIPKAGRTGKSERFDDVVVLAVTSTKEVITGPTGGSITRELVVLTVALQTAVQKEFFDLLDTHDATISREVVFSPPEPEPSSEKPERPSGEPAENPDDTLQGLEAKLLELKIIYEKCYFWVHRFITKLDADQWPYPEWELQQLNDLSNGIKDLKKKLEEQSDKTAEHVKRLKEQLAALESDFLGLCGKRGDLHRAVMRRRGELEEQLSLRFPKGQEEQVQATELGTILKAIERYPYDNYGIETTVVFPRLKDVLTPEITKPLVESKNTLDMLLLMSFLALVFWLPASAVLALYTDKIWAFMLCFIGAPVLAWLCYKAAIQATLSYGENLKSIYDLHRWKLLKRFSLELPDQLTLEDEKAWWGKVNTLLTSPPAVDPAEDPAWRDQKYKITGE